MSIHDLDWAFLIGWMGGYFYCRLYQWISPRVSAWWKERHA